MNAEDLKKITTRFAESTDSDVLIYTGPVERPYDSELINLCNAYSRRTNLSLFLCTYGGDANAGYRIARCFQQKYSKFTIYICGPCKSAGTLLAIGANEIVISDNGEMGPLDVQLGKKDEIWETDSGLTILRSIETLEEKAFELFEDCFLKLKMRSGGRITLKTASEFANNLAIGVMSPIVAQIDPMHIGEVSRAMKIGYEYGTRLSEVSKNCKDDTLNRLTYTYPSHGFVIDRQEATLIFHNVREPNRTEIELIEAFENLVLDPSSESIIGYVSSPKEELKNENGDKGRSGETSDTDSGKSSGIKKVAKQSGTSMAV